MDLFSMLGIEAPQETPVTEKKEKKSADGKGKGKTSAKKHEIRYQLPLTIVTGWHEPVVLEGTEKFSDKQLREKIHELFPEYSLENMTVSVRTEKNSVYVGFMSKSILAKGTMKLRPDTVCCLGGERLDISAVFSGTDEQDVNVSDISKVLENICPVFRGCVIAGKGDMLVPLFSQPVFTDSKMSFPINVLFFGRGTMQVTQQQYADAFALSGSEWDASDGTVSAKALTDIILKQWTDLDERFTVLKYDKDQNMILVVQQVGEETRKEKATSSDDVYPTEGTTLSVIFQKLPLSPELFGGKKSVTKKELQTYVSGIFPEYSGDNVDFVYNKDSSLIVPVLRGSRKGALDVVYSENEYDQRVNMHAAPFCYLKDGMPYRVESTQVMLTACSMTGSGEGWFTLHTPRIPGYMIHAVYKFFQWIAETYETEVRVQAYYDSEVGKYLLYLPRQEVTATSVYTVEAEYLKMSETVWPVLDIHSHCRFPAMWSGTDNAYELGNWVYGVIGSIGTRPSMKLRVGTGGNFMELIPDHIIDESAVDSEKTSVQYQILCAEAKRNLIFVEQH